MNATRQVVDENATVHTLTECLGRGGQGEVWLAEGGRRVVKICSPTKNREALRRQMAAVKLLPLQDLHVARPLALLRAPHVGYVAEFLADMVPIRELVKPPRGTPVGEWYCARGGLRRRLRLLAHAGEALEGLHGRGLIYGDISHANVFVSGPPDALEAWLIDLDNVRHDSDVANAIYTLGYGAPEIVAGSCGATSLSDAWSFGVLAFQVLTLVHPLCGDAVSDGEPEFEEAAFAGRLPWIDHTTEEGNRSTQGIAREKVFSKHLAELARRTFEDGVHDRTLRPGIGAWVERLHQAADRTIGCEACHGTYLTRFLQCTWCGTKRPPLARMKILNWEPGHGVVDVAGARAELPLTAEPFVLTRRHTRAEVGVRARVTELSVRIVDRGVRIETHGTGAWVSVRGARDASLAMEIPNGRTKTFSSGTGCIIHLEPADRPHRVIVIEGGAA